MKKVLKWFGILVFSILFLLFGYFFLMFSGLLRYGLYSSLMATRYGHFGCGYMGSCNNVGKIDCGAAVDGPLYYINLDNGEIIGRCGGYCMAKANNTCQNCPPQDWESCEFR